MSQINTVPDMRETIRRKIVPFGGIPPDQLTFCVGWTTEALTFEQIVDTLRPQIVQDLLYFKKMARQYISDLLQQGWLRLWQALHENAGLLATMNHRKAADFVSNRCGTTVFKEYLKRYDSYHTFSKWNDPDGDVYEDNITEIVIGSSLKSGGQGRHALFTRVADRLIDIQNAIQKVAQWCLDDIRKLAALYYLTTSVSQADAGRIAGLSLQEREGRKPRCSALRRWTQLVLERLQQELSVYQPLEPNRHVWREQIKAGDTEPILQVAEKYANDEMKLLALYSLTTRVARTTIVEELGVDDSALWYAMKQLRQELRCIYARHVLGRV